MYVWWRQHSESGGPSLQAGAHFKEGTRSLAVSHVLNVLSCAWLTWYIVQWPECSVIPVLLNLLHFWQQLFGMDDLLPTCTLYPKVHVHI